MTRRMHLRIAIRAAAAVGLALFLSVAVVPANAETGAAIAAASRDKEPISQAQVSQITSLWEGGGGKLDELNARIVKRYGIGNLEGLNHGQATNLQAELQNDIKSKAMPFAPSVDIRLPEATAAFSSPLYLGSDFYREVLPGMIGQLAADGGKAAIARLERWHDLCSEDAEFHYALALAYGAVGDPDKAVEQARRALAAGLPPGRFLAGPRELLAGLRAAPGFKKLMGEEMPTLLHGPAVCAVTDQSARFWVRTADEADVTVTVHSAEDATGTRKAASAKTTAANDYAAVIEVTGLDADTRYLYSVAVDGSPVPLDPEPTFHTCPTAEEGGRFSVALASRSGYSPACEGMWDSLAQRHPDALLLLGDTLFVSRREATPVSRRYACYRRESSPPFRRFAASTPVYAVWDDNDFGASPSAGEKEAAAFPGLLEVFRQNQVNPSPVDPENPVIWFSFAIADVTFFVLDCTSQRSRPGTGGTMLGAAQKQWLLDGLKNSDATFKLIASSVPWTPSAAWWDSHRTWDAFPEEREEIFSFIESSRVEGVVLLSGGTLNATDVRKIPRENGYDLYELHSSRLTSVMESMAPGGSILYYDRGPTCGLLEFDTTQEDPSLTFRAVDEAGQNVRTQDFVLHTYDLNFEEMPETDGLEVGLAFTKRPLLYGDGSVAEEGIVRIRVENTSDEVQEGTLHLRSVPASVLNFSETPEYVLDPGQVVERTMPIELAQAEVPDLIRIYAREGHDALRVGRKMKALRGKSKGDSSLAAIMELVDFRFRQNPGTPLRDKEKEARTELGRIWFAMVDERLAVRCVAQDAAPTRMSGMLTWVLWDGACLEIFGINRGETGMLGQNIAQIFAIPGIRAIPGTSIIGKPMAYRLWYDPLRLNYPNGAEGEPLPEVKVRSEFTKDGWVLEALVPMKLPVVNAKRTDVSRTVARKQKLIQLYPDQLRIEFQLSVKIHPNDPWTSHGTMQKSWMASQDTENYAYVEWIDVEDWEDNGEGGKGEKKEEKP